MFPPARNDPVVYQKTGTWRFRLFYLLQCLQHLQQEFPYPLGGGDLQPLPAGVDIVHLGSDGNAVQTGQLFAQQTAAKHHTTSL